MATLSNNEEVAILAGVATVGATAEYVAQQTWIPIEIKAPLAGALALVAFVGSVFWAKFVNMKPTQ